LPVLTLMSGAAVSNGVPAAPILPLSEPKLTEPEVKVNAPVLVIEPEPIAATLMSPRLAVETLALIMILALPVSVPSKNAPLPLKESALEIVSVLPEVMETMLVEPLIVPRLTVPVALMVKFLVSRVMVWPLDVNVPPLLNWRLYAPAVPLETSIPPEMVRSPATALDPTIRVPAVMAARSEAETVMVPAPPATVIDLLPLGMIVTVPVPALTAPVKTTSLAVIEIGAFTVASEPVAPFVKLPVPLVVMVTLVVPVAL